MTLEVIPGNERCYTWKVTRSVYHNGSGVKAYMEDMCCLSAETKNQESEMWGIYHPVGGTILSARCKEFTTLKMSVGLACMKKKYWCLLSLWRWSTLEKCVFLHWKFDVPWSGLAGNHINPHYSTDSIVIYIPNEYIDAEQENPWICPSPE